MMMVMVNIGDVITVTCCVDSKAASGSDASEKVLPVVRSAPSLQQVASYSTSDSRQAFLSSVMVICQCRMSMLLWTELNDSLSFMLCSPSK